MKKLVTLLAGAALLSSAFAGNNTKAPAPIVKPWELTFGYHMATGDLEDIGFDGGFMVGLDYYMNGARWALVAHAAGSKTNPV